MGDTLLLVHADTDVLCTQTPFPVSKLFQMQDNACHDSKGALTPRILALCCQMKSTELGNLHGSFQNKDQTNFPAFLCCYKHTTER